MHVRLGDPPWHSQAQSNRHSRDTHENAKWGAASENSSVVSYKDKHALTLCLVIPLLGVYPKEIKTNVHIKMFTPVLFIIAKNWDKPNVLHLVHEQRNCGLPLLRKKKRITDHRGSACGSHVHFTLRKTPNAKTADGMIPFCITLWKRQNYGAKKQMEACRGRGGGWLRGGAQVGVMDAVKLESDGRHVSKHVGWNAKTDEL